MNSLKYLLGIILFFLFNGCTKEAEAEDFLLYTINIEFDGQIEDDEKKAISIVESSQEGNIVYSGKAELHGGFSRSYPKKSYELNLVEDVLLAGLPEDDDWILNANYIDKTFLRHVIAYDMFREMDPENRASLTQFVEVELNGAYNGLYVLMEKTDRSCLEVTKTDPESFIFKEPHLFRSSYEGVEPQKPGNFHQQTFPDIDDDDKTAVLENIRALILNTDDEHFRDEISAVIDIDNLIDWNLLLEISNNSDGILKNFYLYKKDKNTPIRIAPWDYDHSFGRDGDNELNMDRFLDLNRSVLFSRLLKMDWYLQKLKARWNELNDQSILSEEGLKQRIRSLKDTISPLVEKNAAMWPFDGSYYFDDNDFEEEIQLMFQFIALRHSQLEAYFESL